MLATFGLERLEAGLENDTLTASDVAEFLEQAEPIDVRTLARDGMPEALDGLHRRISLADGGSGYLPGRAESATEESSSPTFGRGPAPPAVARQPHQLSQANRQFGPREHAHRV